MQRIAVVEDDETTRFLLDTVLTAEGYEVILVAGPGDLLAQLSVARPDLVLLDLLLGAWGDGLTLAGAIRQEPGWERLPLIVMSAAPNILHRHDPSLIRLRCHVLEKPFDLDDLRALIKGALASAQP
jgi:two-component system response regulator (stage 0 sporulation protein F)